MDNTNKPSGESKKKLMIILGLVAVVAIIAIAAFLPKGEKNQAPEDVTDVKAGEAPADAQPYMPEGAATTTDGGGIAVPEVLKDATVTVVGANPITKEGTVVTTEGVAVKNDATPMSPEAPKQTPPVAADKLPSSVQKLSIASTGFTPNAFSVNAGAAVTLGITSGDDFTHVFMFDNPSLAAVAVGVSPRETRAITFNAPSEKGEYTFHCDVPGHSGRGETGKMTVK